MAAGTYTFTIEQGSTVDFRLEYRDKNNIPIDLSAYTSRMHIRPTITSTTLLANLSSTRWPDGTGLNMTPTSASLTLPKSSGSIGIYISAVTSSLFNFGEAYYDLEIVSGSGNTAYVKRILEGKIKLRKEVTR